MTYADRSRLPDIGPDPAFTFPRIARHQLDNGLQVRTVEHKTMPVVTMVVQVDAGAVADPRGREGLAAISADMLDEGTGSLSAIEVSDAFARIGAEYDVDVGPDVTVFTITTLERFADRGASLLADILLRPSLRDTDFDRVRKLRLDRLRQLKDSPPAVAERAFLRLMYGDHAYGHLPIGNSAALTALALDDVAAFHRERFQPSRATVVVAGPLSHDGLRGLAEGAFSAWEGTAVPPQQGHPAGDSEAVGAPTRLAVVAREAAPQSELRIGHLSAHRNSPDYPALLVMNALLGGQFVSRINLKLREEKGYTYGARTGFDWRRGLAPFALQASVHTASTADAIADCFSEFDAIRGRRPPTESEMALAKASLTRGYPRGFETAHQVARAVSQLALFGLPDTYFEEFVPRVSAIQAEDVVNAAERYIDPARTVTLVVGDYQAVAPTLSALGLGDAQLLPADA
jgi:predicted Zn-dependent peptidase